MKKISSRYVPFAPTTRIPKRNRRITRPILVVSFTAVNKGWAHIENALNLVAIIHKYAHTRYQRTLYHAPRKLSQVSLFNAWLPRRQLVSKMKNILYFRNRTEPKRCCRIRAKIWFKDNSVSSFDEQAFSHRMRSNQTIVLP